MNEFQSNSIIHFAFLFFSSRHESLDKQLREKETFIQKLKSSLDEAHLIKLSLEKQLGEYKFKLGIITTTKSDRVFASSDNTKSINEEISIFKGGLSKELEEHAKQIAQKELEIVELKRSKENIKNQSNKHLDVIRELNGQISDLVSRINDLENAKVKLNSDWQSKYNQLEYVKSLNSEQQIQQLIETRDQALNEVKILENKLDHKENVLKALQTADPNVLKAVLRNRSCQFVFIINSNFYITIA
jgi:chromosome segregation ATPase